MRGPTYLAATTALLQRARSQAPSAGLWEAADLQWWWRRPRSSDHLDQSVVIDEWDRPLATVALTDWGDRWACDPLVVADRAADLLPSIWPRAQEALELVAPAAFETSVRDDDPLMADLAIASGFGLTPARYAETWMAAGDRPPVPSLHDGYRLSDRVRPPPAPPPRGAQRARRRRPTGPDVALPTGAGPVHPRSRRCGRGLRPVLVRPEHRRRIGGADAGRGTPSAPRAGPAPAGRGTGSASGAGSNADEGRLRARQPGGASSCTCRPGSRPSPPARSTCVASTAPEPRPDIPRNAPAQDGGSGSCSMNSRRMPPGAVTKAMRRRPNGPLTSAGPQITS